jgi:polygalacturonase
MKIKIKIKIGSATRLALGIIIASLSALPALAATKVCDVKKFGALGDGTTKDSAAFQEAIDACAAPRNGGTVEVPSGTFVIAPILLKTNITLHLQKDATLLGSPDHDDYPVITEFRESGHQALVSAVNATNVSITGEGTIDGNGASWWHMMRGAPPSAIPSSGVPRNQAARPRLVVFDHCKHVSLTGITVKNSPFWGVVPYYSDDIVIRNVRITATLPSPNTDAIDPFSSSNIVIDHVYADVGDDNVAIKSGQPNSPGPDDPSKNITITDCTFEHGHGVSIGSEIAGGVQNVHVERVTFKGTDQGIRIKANRDRGADVSNISFKDITMDGVTKASISISEYYPKVMPTGAVAAEPVTRLTPHFHNIRIENVTGTNAAWAGAIVGLPESPVTDIVLSNVNIQAKQGLQIAYADVTGDRLVISTPDGSQPITFGPEGKLSEVKK